MNKLKGFFAYPSSPADISNMIERACRRIARESPAVVYKPWKESDVNGRFIMEQITQDIRACDVFAADISTLNFNVTYEIGYAIGSHKRIVLVRNPAYVVDQAVYDKLGLFDTIGFLSYDNSKELTKYLQDVLDISPLYSEPPPIRRRVPVFILGARYKTDEIAHLFSRIKKARLYFRAIDPNEQMRISAFETIQNVAESAGVVVPLLAEQLADANVHNLRAAFIAGLAQAMRKVLLLLQSGDSPIPLDYRDFVKTYKFPNQIDDYVHQFAVKVVGAIRALSESATNPRPFTIADLDLGGSSAENELENLMSYYLRTEEYRRALRGEGRIVRGRKGSGKSAVFFGVRNAIRPDKKRVVLDLKPEGYQLIKFKKRVLDSMQAGTLEHTVTAFWEYVLLMEVCNGILRSDRTSHRYDDALSEAYSEFENRYGADMYLSSGDFAERLMRLIHSISERYEQYHSETPGIILNQGEITHLVYRHDIDQLRHDVANYMRNKSGLWILIDNLDKGWPSHGLERIDVLMIRCLLDASRKLEQWMAQQHIECHTLVFLRNDVYELLLKETSDRGKEDVIPVDWEDADLLRELLKKRSVYSGFPEGESFYDVWHQLCVTHINGEETSQYLIDRSLMRPRYLLNLINHCKSSAVNLGHTRIEENDLKKGVALYSKDTVFEINLEIQDVLPGCDDILYAFSGCPARVSSEEVHARLRQWLQGSERVEELKRVLLWFGVFGIVRENDEIAYIYNVGYDPRRLQAIETRQKVGGRNVTYCINPAFWETLEISDERADLVAV